MTQLKSIPASRNYTTPELQLSVKDSGLLHLVTKYNYFRLCRYSLPIFDSVFQYITLPIQV